MGDAPSFLIHTPWLWLALALASSLLSAQNVESNRRAKQEGFRLNFWRMGIAALFWLPLSLLQHWPDDWKFYGTAVFGGMALIIGFTIQNDLATRHNGRVAIIHMPLKAVLVFALWAFVDPTTRAHVLERPLITTGVIAALATMVCALAEFRKNDVSWSSFRAVIPIVVVYAFGDIFTRLTISPDNLHARLVIFLFLVAASSALTSLAIYPWRPKPELPLYTPKLAKDAVRAAIGGTANQVCFFMALVLGPSPAYVSMVALMAPVWLLVYHRWAGIKDDASPVAGTLVVIAAIVLMFIVS